MQEVVGAANRIGLAVNAEIIPSLIELTRKMGPYKPSTLVDFERGLPLEMESMFLKPLAQGRSTGGSMPLLSRLCEILASLNSPTV